MIQNKRFTSLILLPVKLTKETIEDCFLWFLKNDFLAYDFKSNSYTELSYVLNKYPNRMGYSLQYENQACTITYTEGEKYIINGTDANTEGAKIIGNIVHGLCATLKSISFAYIDNEGDAPNKMESYIKKLEIKWLFKYNYFGKVFIEKYGKDFFINMPCVKYEFIGDDIIRIDLVKDIFDKTDEKLKTEINDYLEKHSIKVRFYDYKQHYID